VCQVKSQTVAFRYSSASDVSAVVPYSCRQTAAQSVATVVLFSIVSVCGSLGVCLCVIVNAITPQPFHKIYMAARYQQCTNSVPIVKNSQKTVKTAKMTIGVPIVTCLSRLYQQRTNRQKQSTTVKRQSNQQKLPLVYQSSHVYTESAEYTKSASAMCMFRTGSS